MKKVPKILISGILILGLLLIQTLISFTLKFTAWPEMVAYPYLLSRGYHFYGDIIQPYTPLLPYALLAVGKLVGISVGLLRLFTIASIIGADIIFWLCARLFVKRNAALVGLLSYILLQWLWDANELWFDLFLIPFSLTALYGLLIYVRNHKIKYLLIAAVSLSLAVLVKQTAIWWAILIIFYLWQKREWRALKLFSTIFLVPLIVIFAIFWNQGIWYWAIVYPFTQATRLPGYVSLITFNQLPRVLLLVSPLFLMGLFRKQLIIFYWGIAALLFTFPRFDYFHLQAGAPLIILSGLVLFQHRSKVRFIQFVILAYLCILIILTGRYALKNQGQPVRFFEPEVISTAQKLANQLPHNQEIFFYNTPSQYFVSAQLLPLKPWADTFPWYLEIPGLQQQIIDRLEEHDLVVEQNFIEGGSYALGAYRPQDIQAYLNSHYVEETRLDSLRILKRKVNR
jgi:hypothetical protein